MCTKCGGTGKFPFKREDGTVVPHVFEYCTCRREEPTSYHPGEELFDFPLSYDWRRYAEVYQGRPDPGYGSANRFLYLDENRCFGGGDGGGGGVGGDRVLSNRVIGEERKGKGVFHPDAYQELKGELRYLENKLNSHVDASKKAAQNKVKSKYD